MSDAAPGITTAGHVSLIARAKGICLHPKEEWPLIAEEVTTTSSLIKSYVLPLALIGPACAFVGGSLLGRSIPFVGTYRVPLVAGIGSAIVTFLMAIVGTLILSLVINGLAPTFGGEKNQIQALKLAVYSYTPAWIAGVLNVFTFLGLLTILASCYGVYLLYLGVPRLMKSPAEKAFGYTAAIVVCAVVLSIVVSAVTGVFIASGAFGSAGLAGLSGRVGDRIAASTGVSSGSGVAVERDSPLVKLQQLGKQMEAASARMEAAQRNGDPNAQAAAAGEVLGTLLGGGKRVTPVAIGALKPFLPETFASLPRATSKAESGGALGLGISVAEATYRDGDKNVTLKVTDTGGVSGLTGLAGWMNLAGEREDEDSSEKTEKVDGRLVHERNAKRPGGRNEFSVVLGDRFVVETTGTGVDLGALKSSVAGLDLGKLEGLKSEGVAQ